jgi:NADPH:quinone reductase-like Zn-dependent oxidoreductase
MKAAVACEDYVIRVKEVPLPKPQPGQALVKIMAAAFNRRDYWITQKLYPGIQVVYISDACTHPQLPCILGSDGSGIVVQVGSDRMDLLALSHKA